MLIYLLRHGAVAQTSPRRFLGRTDVPLSEEGVRQMAALAPRLERIGFGQAGRAGRIVASPLERARHSALLASGRPEEDIQLVAAFQEINLGSWEGLSVAEVQERYPGAYEARGEDLAHFRPHGGESFSDVADRVWPALLRLAADSSRGGGGPLLIVAHAGVNRVLLARAAGLPLQEVLAIPQPYGALSCLHFTAGKIELHFLP